MATVRDVQGGRDADRVEADMRIDQLARGTHGNSTATHGCSHAFSEVMDKIPGAPAGLTA